ncbi:unnamed protein product, partial [Iphiclides podalirius]
MTSPSEKLDANRRAPPLRARLRFAPPYPSACVTQDNVLLGTALSVSVTTCSSGLMRYQQRDWNPRGRSVEKGLKVTLPHWLPRNGTYYGTISFVIKLMFQVRRASPAARKALALLARFCRRAEFPESG